MKVWACWYTDNNDVELFDSKEKALARMKRDHPSDPDGHYYCIDELEVQ